MTDEPATLSWPLSPSQARRVDQRCDEFAVAWQAGQPRIEDFLADVPEPERAVLLRELVLLDIEFRRSAQVADYRDRFPGLDAAWLGRAMARRSEGELPPLATRSPANDYTGPFLPASIAAEFGTDEPPPNELFGNYEILDRIGKEGMGVVYKARHRDADLIVALKVIRPDLLERVTAEKRQELIDRFVRERLAAARIVHDHVVPVYGAGEINGRLFYTMRLVEGPSLWRVVREKGPMPNDRAAKLIERVATAVDFIHTQGILHRDLTPKNILLDADDHPYVTDFGLAKWRDEAGEITQTGDCLGNPPYMSPEQIRNSAKVTEASDIYSLGATLYDLLTGRPPFRAATPPETWQQVLHEKPVSPRRLNPAVARDLDTITLKCLEKEPAHRFYRTAAALSDDLRRYLDSKPIKARPTSPGGRVWRWCRQNPLIAGLLVSVAALSLFATMMFVSGSVRGHFQHWAAAVTVLALGVVVLFGLVVYHFRTRTSGGVP